MTEDGQSGAGALLGALAQKEPPLLGLITWAACGSCLKYGQCTGSGARSHGTGPSVPQAHAAASHSAAGAAAGSEPEGCSGRLVCRCPGGRAGLGLRMSVSAACLARVWPAGGSGHKPDDSIRFCDSGGLDPSPEAALGWLPSFPHPLLSSHRGQALPWDLTVGLGQGVCRSEGPLPSKAGWGVGTVVSQFLQSCQVSRPDLGTPAFGDQTRPQVPRRAALQTRQTWA